MYGLDLISATDGGGVQTYHLYDGLGSVTDLTDDEGDVVDGYTYDVFGALRSGSPGATDFLFTGEQLDADSEMYYLRARYYDPETGRFLSQDPLPRGNLYAYVRNNPIRYLDPYGLAPWDKVGDVVSSIADCGKDPIGCGEEIAGGVINAVDSFASTPFGAVALCNPANPLWAIGCTIALAANPEVLPYISTGIQIADLLPWGNIPIVGQAIGQIFDISAFIALEIEIIASDCPWQPLTLANLGNLGVGTLGNFGSFLTVNQASAIEAVSWGATTAYMQSCGSVAHASPDDKE